MNEDKHHASEHHGDKPKVEIVEVIEIIEILDLEDHAKRTKGAKPPKAHHYKIRVDREYFKVKVPAMTGREILELASKKPPEKYLLNQKFHHGQVVPITLEQVVDFTCPGIERFTTLPKDQTEGRDNRREHFKLPEEDTVQLTSSGYDWETVPENWLVVHGFPLPPGYNVPSASVAVRIPTNYPTAPLDMAYFHPSLQLSNKRMIPNVGACMHIDGKVWQQWSRHYTPQHPWLPEEYNVITHLSLVRTWLDRELTRN